MSNKRTAAMSLSIIFWVIIAMTAASTLGPRDCDSELKNLIFGLDTIYE